MKFQKYLLLILITGILTIGWVIPVMANPTLRVDQTTPDTFINDTVGHTYKAKITNIGDTIAQNIAVNIQIPDGFTRIGSINVTDNNGIVIPITVSGANPFYISFDTPLSLDRNQFIEITYQLATDFTVAPGNSSANTITVNETYDYNDVVSGLPITSYPESYNHLVYVKQGKINVTLTPLDNVTFTPINVSPIQGSRYDIITLEAKLTNTGDGPIYNPNFSATWGTNFSAQQLITGVNGGNITPTFDSGSNSFIYTTTVPLQPGDSIYFRYKLTVTDYRYNFTLNSTATSSPASPGSSGASVSFSFIINQPSISITTNAITMEYGDSSCATTINITNNGSGPARNFVLNTNYSSRFTIDTLSITNGWSYAGGVFTYNANGGVINPGQTVPLNFNVSLANPANLQSDPTSGSITIMPTYLNDIDQTFLSPIVYQTYTISNVPSISLAQNVITNSGDSSRIFLGEKFYIEYIPTLTHPEKWTSPEILLNEVVPKAFIIGDVTREAGTVEVDQVNNTIIWHLTLAEIAAHPKLTVNLQAKSNDPSLANTSQTISATISGTTVWCPLSVTRNAILYLQNREDAPADFTYQSKTINNSPGAAGSWDVCGKNGDIEYLVQYKFGIDSTGKWTGSTLSDNLDQNQTYVSGSAEYSTDNGNTWSPVPSVINNSKLTFDLGFLTDIFKTDYVKGLTVLFKYKLRLTDASLLLSVNNSATFTSVTELTLSEATGGSGAGNTFYQGVFVPISRAAMNIGIDLGTNEVSKGQLVHASIHVNNIGNTPWNKNNLTITLTMPTTSGSSSGSYGYLGNLAYGNAGDFGGATLPTVSYSQDTPEVITFTFSNPVTVGGTLKFDLIKTDSNNYAVQTKLEFDDDLTKHFTATASYTPLICEQGVLNINITPDPIQVNANQLTWNINVTNVGNGIAYGAVLENNLNGILNYDSSTPGFDNQNGNIISWNLLPNLNPGDTKTITVTARTNNNTDFSSTPNIVTGKMIWVDRKSAANDYNIVTKTAKPQFVNVNSTSSTFVENLCNDHVELGSNAIIKLHVKNNGWTTNYNYIIKQDFESTGFVYQSGTSRIIAKDSVDQINGDPIGNPSIVGSVLTFSGLTQFQALAPQEEFTLIFKVYAPESFNSTNKIKASATWQLPTDSTNRSGSSTGAEFLVPQFLPNINVAVDGKISTADDSTYSKDVVAVYGNSITWRIQITNSGTADAKKVVLQNLLPDNTTFTAINPSVSTRGIDPVSKSGAPVNTLWDIPDIAYGDTVTYYVTGTFNGNCLSTQKDNVRITWGPETSALTTPGHNTDSANLITQPSVDSVSASIAGFTTKKGTVTVTIVTSGAPLYNLTLPLNISSRFQVDTSVNPITYSNFPAYTQQPNSGDSGATLSWNWSGPIPAGTHTITFDIRDRGASCNDGSIVGPTTNNYIYQDSYNYLKSLSGMITHSYSFSQTPAKSVLGITKIQKAQIAHDNDTITWTITVTNTNTAATNLWIVDTLGNGFTYQNSSVSGRTDMPEVNGNILTWKNITLNAGDTYIITETVLAHDSGSLTSFVTANEWNKGETAKVDEKTDTAGVSMINFTKNLTPVAGTSFGEIVNYTIQAVISDQNSYQNMVIKDTLPTGLEYVTNSESHSTNPGVNFIQSNKTLTWNVTNFTGPGTITLTYQARIFQEGAVAAGSTLSNQAQIGYTITNGSDSVTYNSGSVPALRATKSLTVKEPNITMTETVSPPTNSSVTANQTINHTINVNNASGSNVSAGYEVKITQTLPVGERNFNPTAAPTTVVVKKGGSGGTLLGEGADYIVNYDGNSGELVFNFKNTGPGILLPGENFYITYDTKVDSGIGAGTILNNSVALSGYYSQPIATYHKQSYSRNPLDTTYNTFNSIYDMNIKSPGDKKIRPGIVVTYEAQITIPAGTSVYDVGLSQTLPTGLDYVMGSSIGLNDSNGDVPYRTLTPNISGDPTSGETVTWSAYGSNVDITNNGGSDLILKITFNALVKDLGAISNGGINASTFIYNFDINDNNISSRTSNGGISRNLTVTEPKLKVVLAEVSPSGPYKVDDTVTYNVTISHDTDSTTDAYDVQLEDLLPAGLTYQSYTPGTSDPGAPEIVGQRITWGGSGNIDIPLGNSYSFQIKVKLGPSVEPEQSLNNAVNLSWTSINGSNLNERTYGPVTSNTVTVTAINNTDLAKTILGSPVFVIGETFDYQIVARITKGTTRNVVIHDTLPTGVSFISATISYSSGMTYTVPTNPAPGALNAISWNFGTVGSPGNNDTITIQYTVQILNDAANLADITKSNTAYLSYWNAAGATRNTATRISSFKVKEPELTLEKTYSVVGSWQAGSTVNVTVKIYHNFTTSPHDVTAWNVQVTDQIPAKMINPSAINNSGAAGSGKVTWSNLQVGTNYTSTNPLTLTYQLTLDNTVQPNEQLTGSVTVKWESLSGNVLQKRTGDGGGLNNYSAATSATTNTIDASAFTHSYIGGVEPAIGSNNQFRIQIQLNEGTTGNLAAKATLPAGMKFDHAVITKGNTGINYPAPSGPTSGDTGLISWNFLSVLNPANGNAADDYITIDYWATVTKIPANIQGKVLIIPAHIEYQDGQLNNIIKSDQNAQVTLVEPTLTITKTGPGMVALKTPATFTITVTNTGNGTAWQPVITDTLPADMSDQTPAITSISVGNSPVRTLHDTSPDDYDLSYSINPDKTGLWTITLKSIAARIAPGETLTLTYQAILNNQVFTVKNITNTAAIANYYSLDSSGGPSSETRTYPAGPVTASATVTIQTPVLTITPSVDKLTAHPGDKLHYQIVINNSGNTNLVNGALTMDCGVEYAPNTITNYSTTSGSIAINGAGGANNTGSLSVTGVNINTANQVTVEWDVTLKPVLKNGISVNPVAQFNFSGLPAPIAITKVLGNPTPMPQTLIQSVPTLTMTKRDTDVNGGSLTANNVILYTISINNTGTENAKNVVVTDLIPSNTIYVPNSTTLNGNTVADNNGQTALVTGLTVNTPGDAPGWIVSGKTALVTFRVTVAPDVTPSSIISNQATLMASGDGSGPITPVMSDDPDTETPGDATRSVVGNIPTIYATKTVVDDNGAPLNPNETITYTIIIYNNGTANATNVIFHDQIPAGTTYEPGNFTIDGGGVADPTLNGGSFTISLNTITAGTKRTITFKVRVNNGVTGIISNQGKISLTELPDCLTDSDGNNANGAQPTEIMVGSGAALRLTKLAADLNGGNLLAGETVEFTLAMRNVGNLSATNITIIDPIPGTLVYVPNSASLNGLPFADQNGSSPLLAPGWNIGTVAPGMATVIKYRVKVANNIAPGTTIDTQANYTADNGLLGISDSDLDDGIETGNLPNDLNDDDPTRLQIGASPGTASVSGAVWFDTNYDNINDNGETNGEDWQVQIFQQSNLIGTTTVNAEGNYWFIGLAPGGNYRLQFSQPQGKMLWKVIDNISLLSGTVLANQNLPIHPTGIIYDAITRKPLAEAIINISGPVGFDPAKHLPAGEQGQVTDSQGFYKFTPLFTAGAPQGTYTITVTPPNIYSPVFPSTIIPAQLGVLTPVDQGGVSPVTSNPAPPQGNQPTTYYLTINLSAGNTDLVNNHIPLDPILAGSVLLTKTAAKKTAAIGDFVPYTIQLENKIAATIKPMTLKDIIPVGFKYVKGSAKVNGVKLEPTGDTTLSWSNLSLSPHGKMTVTYTLLIGTRVAAGNLYKNSATTFHGITGTAISNTGNAKVQIIEEPLFSASAIIGKVFNDKNANGVQDPNEAGIPDIRVITTSGKIITTDKFGRYHLEGITLPGNGRGKDIVLKVDPRSVPAGMVFTTENPRVIRLTQGLMAKVNFGLRIPQGIEPIVTPTPAPTPEPVVTPTPVLYPDITLIKVNPAEGLVNTKTTVLIVGTGFRPGIQAAFTKEQTKLAVIETKFISDTQISADLDLAEAVLQKYDLTVTNDDGKSASLKEAYLVKEAGPAPLKGFNNGSLLVTLSGPDMKPGVGIKLVNRDGVTIPGVIVGAQKSKLEVFFNLKDKPTGKYHCYAYYPDGRSTDLNTPVEVRVFSPELYHAQTLLPVYFDFDKDNIRPNQDNSVQHDLEVLRSNPNASIMLGGYTDERGSYVYNLGLSMRRANAVKKYLVDHGINPEQISIYSYGKEYAKKGTTENIWQNDRRVDVVMYEDRD